MGVGGGSGTVIATTGPGDVRVKNTYQPVKPIIIASTSSTSRSQNAGVSAGRVGGSLRARADERGRSDVAVSSAEGPEGTKPGSRPAHPMQNMAPGRFARPQAAQVTHEVGEAVKAQAPCKEPQVLLPSPSGRGLGWGWALDLGVAAGSSELGTGAMQGTGPAPPPQLPQREMEQDREHRCRNGPRGPFHAACVQRPSRSESPGTARSTVSLSRCQASRVACLARSHSNEEPPRAVPQSRLRSGSRSSKRRSG